MNNTALPSPSALDKRWDSESVSVTDSFRTPQFECETLPDALKLVVYLPEIDINEVEITTRGADLSVKAVKRHHVRPNWQALHLEAAQRDYLLNLRLGRSLNLNALQAELRGDVLTITIPKMGAIVTDEATRASRLATG